MDRGALPFKTLKYHTKAVRCVGFHKAYPLLATASDDKTVHIFHATVRTGGVLRVRRASEGGREKSCV